MISISSAVLPEDRVIESTIIDFLVDYHINKSYFSGGGGGGGRDSCACSANASASLWHICACPPAPTLEKPFLRLQLFVVPKNNNRKVIFQALKYKVYHRATWTY